MARRRLPTSVTTNIVGAWHAAWRRQAERRAAKPSRCRRREKRGMLPASRCGACCVSGGEHNPASLAAGDGGPVPRFSVSRRSPRLRVVARGHHEVGPIAAAIGATKPQGDQRHVALACRQAPGGPRRPDGGNPGIPSSQTIRSRAGDTSQRPTSHHSIGKISIEPTEMDGRHQRLPRAREVSSSLPRAFSRACGHAGRSVPTRLAC
jgi:hypothetical protein